MAQDEQKPKRFSFDDVVKSNESKDGLDMVVGTGEVHICVESKVEMHLVESILRMVTGGVSVGALSLKRAPLVLEEAKKAVEAMIKSMPKDFLDEN